MQRLNKFSRLPKQDQDLILDLCKKLPYRTVVEQLSRPREEGGLAFTTCPSSLCKFFYKHHPEAIATEALGQLASAVRVQHQAHGEANFEAILAMVQNRVLHALDTGKPLSDLHQDLRSLQRVQKCFLDDQKFRHKNEHTQDAYLDHVKQLATDLENAPDYVDHTLPHDPGAAGVSADDLDEDRTQLERDIEFAQALPCSEVFDNSTFLRDAARILAARRHAERKQNFLRANDVSPAFALPELAHPTPESLLKLQQQLEREEIRRTKEKEISNQPPKKPQ